MTATRLMLACALLALGSGCVVNRRPWATSRQPQKVVVKEKRVYVHDHDDDDDHHHHHGKGRGHDKGRGRGHDKHGD